MTIPGLLAVKAAPSTERSVSSTPVTLAADVVLVVRKVVATVVPSVVPAVVFR